MNLKPSSGTCLDEPAAQLDPARRRDPGARAEPLYRSVGADDAALPPHHGEEHLEPLLRAHRVRDWAARTAIVLVMQPLESFMSIRLGRRLGRDVLRSEVHGGARPPTYIPIANRIAERLATRIDGTPGNLLLEVLGNRSSTAHILGGAVIASDPSQGVCDARGRVFGYDGLFVADGAAVPAPERGPALHKLAAADLRARMAVAEKLLTPTLRILPTRRR